MRNEDFIERQRLIVDYRGSNRFRRSAKLGTFTIADVGPLNALADIRNGAHERRRPFDRFAKTERHAAVSLFDFVHRRGKDQSASMNDGHLIRDALDFV